MDSPAVTPPRHQQTQERSLRVPSPPKRFIPPPKITDNGLPNFDFLDESHRPSDIPNTDFLHVVTYDSVKNRDVGRYWRYEERREAQDILPFLFLGPDIAARNKDFLSKEGITMCLAIRNDQTAKANLLNPRPARDLGIPVVHIDVMSLSHLISLFPKAIALINEHLNDRYFEFKTKNQGKEPPSSPGKILVFCETGNERSASVVAAYIMAMYSLSIENASQVVQASRFCIALDHQFGYLLSSFQQILEARRDVHRATSEPVESVYSPCSVDSPSSRKKRGYRDTRDSDTEMEEVEDFERFAEREPLAPFADISGA